MEGEAEAEEEEEGWGCDPESGAQRRQAGSDQGEQICGWEWVRLFCYVDITRCFLVMLLCVSSVRTFFLN